MGASCFGLEVQAFGCLQREGLSSRLGISALRFLGAYKCEVLKLCLWQKVRAGFTNIPGVRLPSEGPDTSRMTEVPVEEPGLARMAFWS